MLDVDDPAVVRRNPPVPVWVDLDALTDQKHRGRPHDPAQAAGVFVQGVAPGVLWAWVRTQRGFWLGVVTMELERNGAPLASAPGVVPDWAISRRRPGTREHRGKTSNRPTAAQSRPTDDPAAT